MLAHCLKIKKDTLDVLSNRSHGIGSRDCEFKSVRDVINHYKRKMGVDAWEMSETLIIFQNDDSNLFINIEPCFGFRYGHIVRSNNNISPVRFDWGEIIESYLDNYNKFYLVRFADGSTRRCREIDLIQVSF